uniref:Aminopeptidase n=1 Tax=Nilaparvata lugens TaxID=108931 RepID=A0A2L1IQ87_NILLU|nr:putative APN-3 [Nilaparvata lugens]
MTKPPEVVSMMDGTTPSLTVTRPPGFIISRLTAALFFTGFVLSLLFVALLAYALAPCHGMGMGRARVLGGGGSPTANWRRASQDVRLPRSVLPHSYEIKLVPFIWEGNFTFAGQVDIVVNVTQPTRSITLHVNDIEVHEATLSLISEDLESPIRVTEVRNDSVKQFLVVSLGEELKPEQQYKLSIRYTGQLNDILQGFYRSSYTVNNTKRWIATTQFQSTDARRAFPCFDEPALKAKFTMHIARPYSMIAISNMPKITTTPADFPDLPGYEWDHFKESVPMSTYLVAFTVSDFEKMTDGRFSVFARHDALAQAHYSLEIGPKILKHYEQYYNIEFPLPKLDMIALPDFSAGAMENWGLITYRETTMLYQDGISTNKHKMRVATVISHELAHQWFGNLVTPAWWNDLWLKEGFATFIGYTAINHMEPSWKVLDQFLLQQVLGSMKIDSLNATHEIEVEVEEPKDIVQIFDNISYMKGASIINMMSQFLGERVFRAGLKRYLTEHAYSNACQDQLWRAVTVEAASSLPQGVDVKQIMDTWTLLPGFPVVTVHRDYEQGTASVTQERYFVLNEFTSEDKWWVPVSYTTQSEMDFNNTQPKIWLEPFKPTKKITNIDPNDWLLINLKHTGYYKVNYDEENWRRLQESYLKMPETIRAQLLSDVFSLAATGRTNYSTALGFSLHLPRDNSYFPWSIASEKLSFIGKLMRDTDASDDLKKYMLHLVVNTNKELTFFPKTPITGYLNLLLQLNLVGVAADSDHQKLVHEAKQFLNDEILGKNVSIMADFKTKAYCTAIKHGGYEEWNFLWKKYHETNIASDRVVILMALGCSKNSTILSMYLNRILDPDSEIRKQDGAFLFEVVANKNPVLAFDFLKKRWENLQSYFGLGFRQMAKIIESLGTHLNMEQQLIELEKLRSDHMQSLGSTSNSFKQTIERVKFNIQWMNNHYESVTTWLKEMLPKLKKT